MKQEKREKGGRSGRGRIKISQRQLTIAKSRPPHPPLASCEVGRRSGVTDPPHCLRQNNSLSPPFSTPGEETCDNKYRENEKLLKTSFLTPPLPVILVAPRDAALKTRRTNPRATPSLRLRLLFLHPRPPRGPRGWASGHANYLYAGVSLTTLPQC